MTRLTSKTGLKFECEHAKKTEDESSLAKDVRLHDGIGGTFVMINQLVNWTGSSEF